MTVIWWRKMDFIFWDTKQTIASISLFFQATLICWPWWWGLCTQGQLSLRWGRKLRSVFSQGSCSLCFTDVKGSQIWRQQLEFQTWSQTPKYSTAAQQEKKKCVFVSVFSCSKTWTDKSHRKILFFSNTQENWCFVYLHKDCCVIQIHTQFRNTHCHVKCRLLWIFFLFSPDCNNITGLFLNTWKKKNQKRVTRKANHLKPCLSEITNGNILEYYLLFCIFMVRVSLYGNCN